MLNRLTTIIFLLILFSNISLSKDFLILQSTTSTRDSGFYDYLLPFFFKEHNIEVRVIAVGTGQAIKNSENCDADILIAHHRESEVKLLNKGYGLYRKEFMYNDYVLVGPSSDPYEIKNNISIEKALEKISTNKLLFVSRGDDSGTYKKEISLWKKIKIIPDPKKNQWYLSVGQGMGASLNIAVNKNAYLITDRATWISFKNKNQHEILVQNEPLLYNYYGVIPINPKKCPNVKAENSQKFVSWLLNENTKTKINQYRLNNQQLFFSVNSD